MQRITLLLMRVNGCITFVTLGELTQWRVIRDWGPRLPLATFNTKDFADYAEHDGHSKSGGRGIRTHGEVALTAVFKTAAIGH